MQKRLMIGLVLMGALVCQGSRAVNRPPADIARLCGTAGLYSMAEPVMTMPLPANYPSGADEAVALTLDESGEVVELAVDHGQEPLFREHPVDPGMDKRTTGEEVW